VLVGAFKTHPLDNKRRVVLLLLLLLVTPPIVLDLRSGSTLGLIKAVYTTIPVAVTAAKDPMTARASPTITSREKQNLEKSAQ